MIAIINVVPKENYILELEFNNSEVKYLDMKEYLNHGIFQELKNPELFKTVKIFFDTVNWQNGADLCPEILYEKSISQM